MGWKALKEHFKIDGVVSVRDGYIWVGSEHVPMLIRVNMETGTVEQDTAFPSFGISYCQSLFKAAAEDIKSLIDAEDYFDVSIPIYTYDETGVVVKYCESPSWPNVTHDGSLIYANSFSIDKNEIEVLAKVNARSWIRLCEEQIQTSEEKLDALNKERDKWLKCLNDLQDEKLNAVA